MYSFSSFELVHCSLFGSWPAYRFLRRQIGWSGIPVSKNFPQFVVIHRVKGFGVGNKAEVDVFLELSCFFDVKCTGGSDQNHLQEEEIQKIKMVVWGSFKNSWKKKTSKRQGEKERYTHLNAHFQRIARRDKNSLERLENSSRKLEIPREHFMQRWA